MTLSLNDRMELLIRHGFDPFLVSAVLNVAVEDVVLALSDSNYELQAAPSQDLSGLQLATYAFQASFEATIAELSPQDEGVFFVDPVALTGGLQRTLTVPPLTYGAGGIVFQWNGLTATIPASDADLFDLFVNVIVTNAAGTEAFSLSGGTSIETTQTSGTLTALSPSPIAGTDLSFDSGSQSVVSAAGGIYSSITVVNLTWD